MKFLWCTIFWCGFHALAIAQRSNSYFRFVDYYNPSDSTTNYGVVYRPNQPAKGMLVLLSGFGESPFLAERETKIPEVAATNGLLTVILTGNQGTQELTIAQNMQAYLDSIIPQLLIRYNISTDNYYLGGFSMGGAGIIKYVQYANLYNIKNKPNAVFAIDPPLDFLRLYKVYNKWYNDTSITENRNKTYYKLILDKLESYFKGNVIEDYQNYVLMSPFCPEDKSNSGVQLFGKMPIQIFCEPDFTWAINEKHWDAYELNIIDNVGFINALRKNGNKDAQLIITENKGYRKIFNIKDPHSWSIANANEVVKWLLKY